MTCSSNYFIVFVLSGDDTMKHYKLNPTSRGYGVGYDPHVNPGTLDIFATAAFRSSHSMIPGHIEYVYKQNELILYFVCKLYVY